MFGLIITMIGILFLLHNLGLIPYVSWSIIWPVLLIIIGISIMEKRYWWRSRMHRRFFWDDVDENNKQ